MTKIAPLREFSNIKIMLKMSKKREYFHSKGPLVMFGGVFHVSPHTRPCKTTKVS